MRAVLFGAIAGACGLWVFLALGGVWGVLAGVSAACTVLAVSAPWW